MSFYTEKSQQLVYLTHVKIQMADISAYHVIERHPVAFVVRPIVVELCLVNGTDDVADVLIVVFQQHHQLVPVLLLIVLQCYPQVVVLRIVREDEHTQLCVRH